MCFSFFPRVFLWEEDTVCHQDSWLNRRLAFSPSPWSCDPPVPHLLHSFLKKLLVLESSFSVETQTITGLQREGRVSGGKCLLSRFKLCLERSLQHSDVGKAVRETNSCPQVKFNPPTQTLSAIKTNTSKAIFLTHVAIFLY